MSNTPNVTEAMEAHAFRTLVAHLQKNTDVQNIDLYREMGMCVQVGRSCMATDCLCTGK